MSKKTLGQSAAAGADLDHERRVIAACSFRDALESLAFDEKMLAEFLPRQSCGLLTPDIDVPAADEDLSGNLLPNDVAGVKVLKRTILPISFISCGRRVVICFRPRAVRNR